MFCSNCGNNLHPNAKFCNVCGTAVANDAPTQMGHQPTPPMYTYTQPQSGYNQPQHTYTQPVPAFGAEQLSWKEFYNRFVSKKSKNMVTWMVVICFVTTLISLVYAFLFKEMMDEALLDIAVYLLSGILLAATKHWLTVLIPTIYGGIWMVVSFTTDGPISGIAAVVIGVGCISLLFKANAAYKKYKEEGILPENPI